MIIYYYKISNNSINSENLKRQFHCYCFLYEHLSFRSDKWLALMKKVPISFDKEPQSHISLNITLFC